MWMVKESREPRRSQGGGRTGGRKGKVEEANGGCEVV